MVDLGGWLGAIIIGGLAGWVASMIMKTNASMGILANIVVGIIGAIIANWLLPKLGLSGSNGFSLWSFVVALIGAIILLFIVGLFTRRRSRT
ncbi:MAG TPA: GlsB/YeaQ/YmgE family stress response membrane protein [Candidatus Saccharimonadales bacterium]|nr:GlsB/YeaQ/YmgE family stress response membrane protein [Candidatus Saccharimonadales bacterium]